MAYSCRFSPLYDNSPCLCIISYTSVMFSMLARSTVDARSQIARFGACAPAVLYRFTYERAEVNRTTPSRSAVHTVFAGGERFALVMIKTNRRRRRRCCSWHCAKTKQPWSVICAPSSEPQRRERTENLRRRSLPRSRMHMEVRIKLVSMHPPFIFARTYFV